MALEEINSAILECTPGNSVCGNLWHKHWLVAFDYGGNELLVCEATKDRKKELIGRWSLEEKTAVHNVYSYERHLGEHRLPKARVQDVVKEMRYMGKYHATENNCQKWAMELLRRLRIQVPPDQLDAETVVGSAKPAVITTIVGMVLTGAVVIVKGTFGVCS
ncbi:hypothetical protein MRX96_041143 [Rhipicephalus microplus]